MTIAADFITYMKTKSTITDITSKIASGAVPDLKTAPFIWFEKSGEETENTLEGTVALRRTYFAVECVDTTNLKSMTLGDAVRDAIHNSSGTFGASTAKGVFVGEVNDDYIFKNEAAAAKDLAYALNVEIVT